MFDSFDFSKPIIDFSNFELSQLGDAFLFGGGVLLIGMATVFAVLCVLWGCLVIFRLLCHDLPAKRSKKKKITPVVTTIQKAEETKVSDDGELIAVISAAIAMAESDNSGMKFRVVSFRKV